MNRRGFLQACLASATAPYVVTAAGVLMPVRKIVTFGGWVRHPLGDYLTDPDDWYIARESIFKGDIIVLTREGIRRAMYSDTLKPLGTIAIATATVQKGDAVPHVTSGVWEVNAA